MAAEETIYAEVMSAIDAGDRARARDLLTRLLKTNQENPQYWLWMSAVVDTAKERIYCLKEALRRDPTNETARRGLILSGAAPAEAISAPAPLMRRNWQSAMQGETRQARPNIKTMLTAGGGALVLLLVLLGIFGGRLFGAGREQTVPRLPTVDAALVEITTPTTTPSGVPTLSGSPQPLWMSLAATYTPTPLAVNTPHPRTEAYRSAMRAYEREEWLSALNLFQQVATAEPDAVDALYYIGEVNRLNGDYAAALDAYRQTLAAAPRFAPAHLGLARALLANNPKSWREAQTALESALEMDPALLEPYWELAGLLLDQGDAQAALDVLDNAPRGAQDRPLFALTRARAELAAGDADAAALDARKAAQLDVTLLAAYRLQGEALRQAGDGKGALQPLQTYTNYQPEDAQALAWLGKAYLANGREEDALAAFDRALAVDAAQADIYVERGWLYIERKDGERAVADFETALKAQPRSFPAAFGLGRAQLLMEYNGEAYMQFNRSEGLAKTDAEKAQLYYWRALSLEGLPDQDARIRSAAVKDWQTLLSLPQESYPKAWSAEANQHLAALYTPTVTPKPATATATLKPPTATVTATRKSTRTPTRKP
jgi:tetratricopeptide (TPR) repeat protein